jgi:hypothetical protein
MRRVTLTVVLLLLAFPADAASIAAHRAIYDLKLVRAGDSSSLLAVHGRLAFEIQGSVCEGWTVNFRMVNQFSPAEGALWTRDTQSTAFESGDALSMQYSEKEFVDRKLEQESRIKISRPSADAEAIGAVDKGEAKPFTIPGGALFPMQHQLNVMDKAEQGESRDASLLYDGSDGATTYRAITFIGRRKDAGGNSRDIANSEAKPLAALPSWPVTISYYPTAAVDQDTPSYQVGFDLYSNGVATGLVLDYGDFVLGGELAQFELLKTEACQ